MPRKGENIYRRADGRWEARFITGYDELTGKAKYQYLYAGSYLEAKRLKAEAAIQGKKPVKEKSMTVEKCYKKWLAWKSAEPEIHQSTLSQYRWHAEHHILPRLGQVKVRLLDAARLDDFRQTMLREGRLNGAGGLASYTVNTIMMILYNILKYAEGEGYIAEIPRRKTAGRANRKRDVRVLSREEQAALEKALSAGFDDQALRRIYIGIFLSLYTGLRVGELSGLRWQDVEWAGFRPRITVRHTLQRIQSSDKKLPKTSLHLGPPKSYSSQRSFPLKEEVAQLIRNYYSGLSAQDRQPQAFVFGKRGKPAEPRIFQEYFKRILRSAGVEDANFHCLRHTFATRCIESNMDVKSLSEYLGHSCANITLKVYAHSFLLQKETCINRLNFLGVGEYAVGNGAK